MNHLAHLKLAMGEPHLIAGALLGDTVKGRLVGRLDDDLELGIRLHREIDAFTDANPVARRSYTRFPARFRRYGPILVDIFYDHLLATDWDRYHGESLDRFTHATFAALASLGERVPPHIRAAAQRIEQVDLLRRYAELATIANVLRRVSGRMRRANPVAEAVAPFEERRAEIEQDFAEFFPLLDNFVRARLATRDYQNRAAQRAGAVR